MTDATNKPILLNQLVFLTILFLFLSGCRQTKEQEADFVMFKLLPPEHTNITFINELKESSYTNYFVYEYFYNGGGVAIGDVNNDGLDDIYFTSNLKNNKLYLNKGGLQFQDISKQAGVFGKKGWATGVTMIDINQDGLLDIYVCRAGRFTDIDKRRNELFVNQGKDKDGVPIFKEVAAVYGLDDPSFTTQASFFDYDGDGDLDAFLGNYNIDPPSAVDIDAIEKLRHKYSSMGGNKLLKNNNGIYEDVTIEAGIHSHMMNYTLGLSVGDMNNDGWADIYIANDYSEPDHLYINNRDGTYKDVTHKSMTHIPNFSMGSDIGDINNDGWPDIISLDMAASDNYTIKTSMSGMNIELFNAHVNGGMHHQYMYNALQLNNHCDDEGNPIFSDIAQIAGVSNTDWSWSPLLADFDNDGFNDLFVTNGIKRDFRNNDFATFLRKAVDDVIDKKKNPLKYYLQWTQFSPTRERANCIYKNNGNLKFSDVSEKWGFGKHLSFSSGSAYSDLDNDGDLDLIVNNIDAFAFIYENQSNLLKKHHFLTVKLKGLDKNKSGIGTKIKITHKDMVYAREQYPTRGFQSSVSEVIHFGLGNITKIEELVITWPDGRQQKIENIKTDQLLLLDYKNAEKKSQNSIKSQTLFFKDITTKTKIKYQHKENPFNDFERESLLPHKMSQMGPALSVGDINNDGLDDIYIGGAIGQSGTLFIQNDTGEFVEAPSPPLVKDKEYEDVDSVLFDADGDGDLDLYIVSGGNERKHGDSYYIDRFYENDKGIFVKNNEAIPAIPFSGGCVIASDYDNDGDKDLFVGGRQIPNKYPNPENSYIFRNDSRKGQIKFTDVSSTIAPALKNLGMVTDAVWADIDRDGMKDLLITGEWMTIKILKYTNGIYKDITPNSGISEEVGWWNCIITKDFDQDGDLDFVAGNLGLNYKYKASKTNPFEVFATDFDQTGTDDIVLGYHDKGELYPVRGRECSSRQMPFIKEKFPNYDAFGKASILKVYGKENLDRSTHYAATNFATSYIENLGEGKFNIISLPNFVQITSVNNIEVQDINKDGNYDLVLTGNMYGSEVETTRNDAGYGVCLLGDGEGSFKSLMPYESGLLVKGEVRNSCIINVNRKPTFVFAKNNSSVQIIKLGE